MARVYALFNTKNKIVKVGLCLTDVTSHMDHSFSATVWNNMFYADGPQEQKKILESIGYKVKTGKFIAQ